MNFAVHERVLFMYVIIKLQMILKTEFSTIELPNQTCTLFTSSVLQRTGVEGKTILKTTLQSRLVLSVAMAMKLISLH